MGQLQVLAGAPSYGKLWPLVCLSPLLKPGELITWDWLWARAKKNLLTRKSGFVFRLGQIGDQVAYQPCPSVKVGAAARANRDEDTVLGIESWPF